MSNTVFDFLDSSMYKNVEDPREVMRFHNFYSKKYPIRNDTYYSYDPVKCIGVNSVLQDLTKMEAILGVDPSLIDDLKNEDKMTKHRKFYDYKYNPNFQLNPLSPALNFNIRNSDLLRSRRENPFKLATRQDFIDLGIISPKRRKRTLSGSCLAPRPNRRARSMYRSSDLESSV